MIRKLLADCRGATAIEYALIVSFVAIASGSSLDALGSDIASKLAAVSHSLSGPALQ